MERDIPPRCKAEGDMSNCTVLNRRERTAYNSTRAGLPCPMRLSKLLGSRSRTLDARAPARSDRERIDSENFIRCVKCSGRGAAGRKKFRIYVEFKPLICSKRYYVSDEKVWPRLSHSLETPSTRSGTELCLIHVLPDYPELTATGY
jgi:hypothetical protein